MKYFIIPIMASLMAVSGCATIIGGSSQTVSVDVPQKRGVNVSCKITNDSGTWYIPIAPGTVSIKRDSSDMVIECYEGNKYLGKSIMSSSLRGMVFGNLLFGGIIGAIIDFSSGSAWIYDSSVDVSVIPSNR